MRGETYDDPAFKDYHLKCPNLKLDHFTLRWDIGRDPGMEEYILLHDMKGYMIDIDANPEMMRNAMNLV